MAEIVYIAKKGRAQDPETLFERVKQHIEQEQQGRASLQQPPQPGEAWPSGRRCPRKTARPSWEMYAAPGYVGR
jgi:hypothetical protein